MYCGHQPSAESARLYYDWIRTKDGKGLTIVSQIRYAHYFELVLRSLRKSSKDLEEVPLSSGGEKKLHPPVCESIAESQEAAGSKTILGNLCCVNGNGSVRCDDVLGRRNSSPWPAPSITPAVPIRTKESESPAVSLLGFRLRGASRLDSGGSGNGLSFSVLVKSDIDHSAYEVFSSGRTGSMLDWQCCTDTQAGHVDIHPLPVRVHLGDDQGHSSRADLESTRVAGDVCVVFYGNGGGDSSGGNSGRKAFYFWVHTSFLTCPPRDMGGVAGVVHAEELHGEYRHWWLPPGAQSLTLRKHEVSLLMTLYASI